MEKEDILGGMVNRGYEVLNDLKSMKPRKAFTSDEGFYFVIGDKCDVAIPASLMQKVFDVSIERTQALIDATLDEYNKGKADD